MQVKANPNLLVLKPSADISKLLVDSEPLLLLVLAITNVADENGEASHTGQRHLRSDPAGKTQSLQFPILDPRAPPADLTEPSSTATRNKTNSNSNSG